MACPPPPLARVGGQGVHHAHGRPICRVVGKPSCAPQAACEPQDRPSNQIKSNPPPPPPPRGPSAKGWLGDQLVSRTEESPPPPLPMVVIKLIAHASPTRYSTLTQNWTLFCRFSHQKMHIKR